MVQVDGCFATTSLDMGAQVGQLRMTCDNVYTDMASLLYAFACDILGHSSAQCFPGTGCTCRASLRCAYACAGWSLTRTAFGPMRVLSCWYSPVLHVVHGTVCTRKALFTRDS